MRSNAHTLKHTHDDKFQVGCIFFGFTMLSAWRTGTFNIFLFMYGFYFVLLAVVMVVKSVTVVLRGQAVADGAEECMFVTVFCSFVRLIWPRNS